MSRMSSLNVVWRTFYAAARPRSAKRHCAPSLATPISARGIRPKRADSLRRRGIVAFPADLGIDVDAATRDWLAAKPSTIS